MDKLIGCVQHDCAECAAIRAENERLRHSNSHAGLRAAYQRAEIRRDALMEAMQEIAAIVISSKGDSRIFDIASAAIRQE